MRMPVAAATPPTKLRREMTVGSFFWSSIWTLLRVWSLLSPPRLTMNFSTELFTWRGTRVPPAIASESFVSYCKGRAQAIVTRRRRLRRREPGPPGEEAVQDAVEPREPAAARQENHDERAQFNHVLVHDQIAALGGDRVEVADERRVAQVEQQD